MIGVGGIKGVIRCEKGYDKEGKCGLMESIKVMYKGRDRM